MHPIRYTHETNYFIKFPNGTTWHPYTHPTQEEREVRDANVITLEHSLCVMSPKLTQPVLLQFVLQPRCCFSRVRVSTPPSCSLHPAVRAFNLPAAPCTPRFTPAHLIPLLLPWEHAGSSLDPPQFPLLCPMLLYQSCIGGSIPGYTEKLGRF